MRKRGGSRPGDGREALQPRGFTLLELLAAIAIVAILTAILLPSLTGANVAAKKAKTRVQFAQWAGAIEAFRNEYGAYPVFDASNLVNGGATAADHPFHDVLAARRRDGSPLDAGGAAAQQNRKRISFFAFGEADFTDAGTPSPNLLGDGFGNTEIAVLVDRNLDGVIDASDYGTLPAVRGMRPGADDFPASGIRADVVFYAPLPDATTARPGFVLSWK